MGFFAGSASCLCWVLYAASDLPRLMQPLVVNAVGLALNSSFMLCYVYFSTSRLPGALLVAVIVCTAFAASAHAALLGTAEPLGHLAAVVSVVSLSSPLAAAGKVVRTKSVAGFPLPPLVMTCLQSAAWLVFGAYIGDASVVVPNALGLLLGIAQVALYMGYAKNSMADSMADAMTQRLALCCPNNSMAEAMNQRPAAEQQIRSVAVASPKRRASCKADIACELRAAG